MAPEFKPSNFNVDPPHELIKNYVANSNISEETARKILIAERAKIKAKLEEEGSDSKIEKGMN
jgi:hypothetical protein